MSTPDLPVVGAHEAPALHCMTWNVRRPVPHLRRDHPDAWSGRRPAVEAVVATECPHILAVQEAVPEQVAAIAGALGDRWTPELVGRSTSGGGEHVGLFVDRARLEVEERRSWALSRHPDRPGSRSWGALFPRIAVRLVLLDRTTGVRFQAVATHLDPFSPLALRRGAELVARTVTSGPLPAVALADWNAGESAASARILGAAGFVDTWDAAAERLTPRSGTYTAYRRPDPAGHRLDRILTRDGTGGTGRGTVRAVVDAAAIGTRRPDGRSPSDHAPVHAVIRWEAS